MGVFQTRLSGSHKWRFVGSPFLIAGIPRAPHTWGYSLYLTSFPSLFRAFLAKRVVWTDEADGSRSIWAMLIQTGSPLCGEGQNPLRLTQTCLKTPLSSHRQCDELPFFYSPRMNRYIGSSKPERQDLNLWPLELQSSTLPDWVTFRK